MTNIKEMFHAISIKRKPYFNEIVEQYELNLMEIEIIGFLGNQPNNNTFTEIMRAKDYAKSHISTAITHLVNYGYIEKQSVNKKVCRLFLLEKSYAVIDDYNICLQKFREDAFSGIKERDIKIFEQVLTKMNDNLTKD